MSVPASALIFDQGGLRVATVGADDRVVLKTDHDLARPRPRGRDRLGPRRRADRVDRQPAGRHRDRRSGARRWRARHDRRAGEASALQAARLDFPRYWMISRGGGSGASGSAATAACACMPSTCARGRQCGIRHRGMAFGGRVHGAAIDRADHAPDRVMDVGRLQGRRQSFRDTSSRRSSCRSRCGSSARAAHRDEIRSPSARRTSARPRPRPGSRRRSFRRRGSRHGRIPDPARTARTRRGRANAGWCASTKVMRSAGFGAGRTSQSRSP